MKGRPRPRRKSVSAVVIVDAPHVPAMAKLGSILFVLLVPRLASALPDVKITQKSLYCTFTIHEKLIKYKWAGARGPCNNTIENESIYATALLYCSDREFEHGLQWWQEECEHEPHLVKDLANFESNVTTTWADDLPTIDPEVNSTKKTKIQEPVKLDYSYYRRAYKSYVRKDAHMARDVVYGWGLMGFWGGILLIGTVANACAALSRPQGSTTSPRGPDQAPAAARRPNVPWTAIAHFIRTHCTVPAAFGSRFPYASRHFAWLTIPKRSDFLIITSWWIVAIVLSFVRYDSFVGNTEYHSIGYQNWHYVSDRTGILAFACLPMIWLFAARNNGFIWATGWSFSSFNLFHRHVARVCTVLAVAHGISMSVRFGPYQHKYRSKLSEHFVILGLTAVVSMCLMLATAHKWIRTRSYECFLLTHIVLAIVVLYGLWIHAQEQGTEYNGYLWMPIATWSADRLLRLCRIAYCNLRVRYGDAGFISLSRSSVTYDKSCDVIRVDVEPAVKSGKPGQYYYLYQPTAWRGWENHPFTLAAYNIKPASRQATSSRKGDGKDEATVSVSPEHESKGQVFTFFLRPYDGWTRRLRDQCLASPQPTIHPRLLLEGPYGQHINTRSFDTVLLIAGGTGISAIVPLILERSEADAALGPATRTTRVHLNWTVRQPAFIEKLCQAELAAARQRDDFETSFFCTQTSSALPRPDHDSVEDSEKTAEADHSSRPSGDPSRQTQHCRPRRDVADEAAADGTSLAVVCCGPPAMADDAREAVHRALKRGCKRVEYFEESFGW
ncbi:ferric reductase transmembrane component 4 precursor [Teratosphaeria destructans]|uniref:Ferric reductase transmembrane component 4 n=1 Tax=Teratosphaeria destructans TaxID=418781 RepID=A0A9W7T157_9PEZI|nr:ferric reductase transmembrane component 4 precursor [Teratosphaeria destructans]